jgi:putative tryptophan/tyrosine transport system substrate-binding protein
MGGFMRRRELIKLLGRGAVAWPLAARAQQTGGPRRIGVLMSGAANETVQQSYLAAFIQGLRQLGWTEGQNIRIDVRWNAGDAELARIYAAQLIGLMPDVIMVSSTISLTVIQQATSTVPVVFVQISDPVEQGFVPNLTQPGGNVTGFGLYEFSIGGKWIELLKEVAPSLTRVAVIFNPDTSPQSQFFMRSIESAASSLGAQAIDVPIHTTANIEPALASFSGQPNGGLIVPSDTFLRLRLKLIAELAVRHRLPSISGIPDFAKEGGLMDYGVSINTTGRYRQASAYVDRILKGTKPGDLPVQLPDKYAFFINLKTAKTLGLTVPPGVLAVADEVIE